MRIRDYQIGPRDAWKVMKSDIYNYQYGIQDTKAKSLKWYSCIIYILFFQAKDHIIQKLDLLDKDQSRSTTIDYRKTKSIFHKQPPAQQTYHYTIDNINNISKRITLKLYQETEMS